MNTLSDEQLKAAKEDKRTIEIQKTQLADAYLRLDAARAELATSKAQSEQYRLETHRWADAAKKDREERDGLWKKIREAQARAERAEGALASVLGQDQTYSLSSVLKEFVTVANHLFDVHSCDHHGYEVWMQARDKAEHYLRTIANALTPAPQGRTDGERLEWLEDDKKWFVGVENDYHERDEADNEALWRVSKWVSDDLCVNGTAKTLRAAIDAAMDATAPEVKGGAA